jgi:hypothetical protein
MRTPAMHQGGGAVVADQPPREADQDRRQGRQPWPLRDVPDGSSRGVTTDVPGHSVTDRPAAATARAGLMGVEVKCDRRQGERSALVRAKRRRQRSRAIHPTFPIASCSSGCDLPLRKPVNGTTILPSKPPGIWRMPVKGEFPRVTARGHPATLKKWSTNEPLTKMASQNVPLVQTGAKRRPVAGGAIPELVRRRHGYKLLISQES